MAAIIAAGNYDPGYEDVDARFLAFMYDHGISALLVRPNYYIYSVSKAGNANGFLASLANSLFLVKEIM